MAICPSCGQDRFAQRRYASPIKPQQIKVYWACTNCGMTEEGYWTTESELEEIRIREQKGDDLDASD